MYMYNIYIYRHIYPLSAGDIFIYFIDIYRSLGYLSMECLAQAVDAVDPPTLEVELDIEARMRVINKCMI